MWYMCIYIILYTLYIVCIIYIYYTHNGIFFSHKKKKILPFTTIWMNLEDIMPSEISQTQKDKYCMISLCVESEIAKLVEAKSSMVVVRGWGRERERKLSMRNWLTRLWRLRSPMICHLQTGDLGEDNSVWIRRPENQGSQWCKFQFKGQRRWGEMSQLNRRGRKKKKGKFL